MNLMKVLGWARRSTLGGAIAIALLMSFPVASSGYRTAGCSSYAGRYKAFRFLNGTTDIAGTGEETAAVYGMQLWSRVASVDFLAVDSGYSDEATIAFSWVTGNHGDIRPFDADPFTPEYSHGMTPCQGPAADVHFDDAVTWLWSSIPPEGWSPQVNRVAAHEVGHAIGLADSENSEAVMKPTNSQLFLGWDDILGAQSIYGRLTGFFHLRNSTSSGHPDESFRFGTLGDLPVAGDWNGDSNETIGIWRPSTGKYVLHDENWPGGTSNTYEFGYGRTGDLPVVGDWNGDGRTTVGVYRPSDNHFYLDDTLTTSSPEYYFGFGIAGDVPLAGDWNGDGRETIGLYRPSNGTFHLRNSNVTGPADIGLTLGTGGGIPVAGDWDGNGIDTVGVFQPSTATFSLRNINSTGSANITSTFGATTQAVAANAKPITGDWNVNGMTDIGIFQN